MKPILLASLALTIVAPPVLAVSPVIRGMKPVGGRRGTEVVVTLTGQRLADTEGLLFYQPGIRRHEDRGGQGRPGQGDLQDRARRVARAARLPPPHRDGHHPAAGRSASACSRRSRRSSRTTTSRSRSRSSMNVTVNGVAAQRRRRLLRGQGEEGRADHGGDRGHPARPDVSSILTWRSSTPKRSSWPRATIRPWSGRTGSSRWSPPRTAPTSSWLARPPTRATRTASIAFTSATSRGRRRPFPAGGKAGEAVTVRWIGDVLGERTTSLTLPASLDRHFGLFAQDDQGIAPFSNAFRLSPFGNTIEAEPNDTAGVGQSVHSARGPQRRDRDVGRPRSLRVQGQERREVRHPRLRAADSLAAGLGALDRGAGAAAGSRTTTIPAGPTATSGSSPPAMASTS